MPTVPITTFLFIPTPATPFIMAIKRKEKDDPTGAATPIVKKTRLSATPTALVTALPTTPIPTQSFAEAKVPALATRIPTVEVKVSKKNPSYGFGKPPTNERIIKALETCIHPDVPLHSLVHPDAAKLYENVNVYPYCFFSLLIDLESRRFFRCQSCVLGDLFHQSKRMSCESVWQFAHPTSFKEC
jgi:hypothetical protein